MNVFPSFGSSDTGSINTTTSSNCNINAAKVFLAYDERMLLHRPPVQTENVDDPNFVHERPSRLRAVYTSLLQLEHRLLFSQHQTLNEAEDLENIELQNSSNPHRIFLPLECLPASRESICRVHSEAHYEFMKETSQLSEKALRRLTDTSEDLYFSHDTYGAALLAAGGCLAAVDAVTDAFTSSPRAMCLVRPPAHHATRDSAMGFCYFNNIVIAANHAIHTGRASRVFILDWDVHHGNGIQDLTYDDPNIFYLSIHRASSKKQWFYPDTGKPSETGARCGVGTNANIALDKGGMGNKEYAAAFSELVLPAMDNFQPDLIMIACGADAAQGDLLGDCGLTPDMYYLMTRSVIETAGVDTPIIAVLEGGYNLPVLADCLQAVGIALMDAPFDSSFVPRYIPPSKATQDSAHIKYPNHHHRGASHAESMCLSHLWNSEEKQELKHIRNSHPEKGLTKRALRCIHNAAHALAFSQSRHGAFHKMIQNPPVVTATDAVKAYCYDDDILLQDCPPHSRSYHCSQEEEQEHQKQQQQLHLSGYRRGPLLMDANRFPSPQLLHQETVKRPRLHYLNETPSCTTSSSPAAIM